MEWLGLHKAISKVGFVLAAILTLTSALNGPRAEAFPAEPLILYGRTCVAKATLTPEKRALALEAFKAKYLRVFSQNADNEKFMRDVVPGRLTGDELFYHVDNVLLKQLSEIYFGDRELVASAEGLFTSLFFANLAKNKKLSAGLIYSDYKTIRLGFRRDDLETRRELMKLHDETAREFGYAMWWHTELHDFFKRGPGPVANPEMWHLAGVGKTPDEAATVARYGRYLYKEMGERQAGHVPMLDFNNEHTHAELLQRFDHVEQTRNELQRSLESAGREYRKLLDYNGGGKGAVLSREAIEILRRLQSAESREDYLDQLKEAFHARFPNIELSASLISRLQNYAHAIDTFMPSIYEPTETMDFGFSRAVHGSVMFDVAGQNARNIVEAMKSLAKISTKHAKDPQRLELAIKEARSGQHRASLEFDRRRERVRDVISRLGFDPKEVVFSGDDGIFLPDRVLTEQQKKNVLNALRDMGGAGEYRVTFLPSKYYDKDEPIPMRERSAIVSAAEAVEKKVRVHLELGKVPYAELKQMLFAVDIDPSSDGKRKVRIYVSGAQDAAVLEKIQEAVRATVGDHVTIEAVVPSEPIGTRSPNEIRRQQSGRRGTPAWRFNPPLTGQLTLPFLTSAAV